MDDIEKIVNDMEGCLYEYIFEKTDYINHITPYPFQKYKNIKSKLMHNYMLISPLITFEILAIKYFKLSLNFRKAKSKIEKNFYFEKSCEVEKALSDARERLIICIKEKCGKYPHQLIQTS